jgi:hypothetical protein
MPGVADAGRDSQATAWRDTLFVLTIAPPGRLTRCRQEDITMNKAAKKRAVGLLGTTSSGADSLRSLRATGVTKRRMACPIRLAGAGIGDCSELLVASNEFLLSFAPIRGLIYSRVVEAH